MKGERVAVVIVGINQWAEFTLPLILSLKRWEPEAKIVVVDNGSNEPYPKTDGVHMVRLDQTVCYAAAMNEGARTVIRDRNWWLLFLNNDVVCEGSFADEVNGLQRDAIYGRQIIQEEVPGRGLVIWLGIWLALVPVEVFDDLLGFDEEFKICGFEDADFCVRGKALEYPTLACELPFTHYWGQTRWDMPNYPQVRKENIEYFERKHGFRLGTKMEVVHD